MTPGTHVPSAWGHDRCRNKGSLEQKGFKKGGRRGPVIEEKTIERIIQSTKDEEAATFRKSVR